ncbi:MAG TPA: type II toxin-antitoxin system HipA family toxin [Gemmatimonadaceae bacterium]|nr:type II toxin-antitoxin system HipA family toxin [Gemmatimonadaceae bacterium]
MHNTHVADLHAQENARIELRYTDAWLKSREAIPISLSMPLSTAVHESKVVTAFLWGLLPDNTETLRHYGTVFGVSPRNPVALLTHMGEDCAGALQFVSPERLGAFTGTATGARQLERITDAEVAADLRRVRRHGVAVTDRSSPGRFSLPGAQPKIALYRDESGWARAIGRTATTHILKPPASTFEGFAENEHFCLALAAAVGIRAARTHVQRFEDEVAIVVERYDRRWVDDTLERIHQEDSCQALGVHPEKKYESDGGPGARAIAELLLESSSDSPEDVRSFLDALILNWAIAGTDAHAKNYSILHSGPRDIRMAPLYDVASYLPYDGGELHRVKLAMRIGREYRARRVTRNDWRNVANSLRVPKDEALSRVRHLLERIPEAASDVARASSASGLEKSFVDALAQKVRTNAQRCLKTFDASEDQSDGA